VSPKVVLALASASCIIQTGRSFFLSLGCAELGKKLGKKVWNLPQKGVEQIPHYMEQIQKILSVPSLASLVKSRPLGTEVGHPLARGRSADIVDTLKSIEAVLAGGAIQPIRVEIINEYLFITHEYVDDWYKANNYEYAGNDALVARITMASTKPSTKKLVSQLVNVICACSRMIDCNGPITMPYMERLVHASGGYDNSYQWVYLGISLVCWAAVCAVNTRVAALACQFTVYCEYMTDVCPVVVWIGFACGAIAKIMFVFHKFNTWTERTYLNNKQRLDDLVSYTNRFTALFLIVLIFIQMPAMTSADRAINVSVGLMGIIGVCVASGSPV